MPDIPVADCCGCTACYNVCPKSAIQMLPDSEGFAYPKVDYELCVGCNMCERVCPIIKTPEVNNEYKAAMIAQSKSDDVLRESTSGGFIDALYKYVLQELGGYAAGVIYNENFLPTHIITDSYEKAKEFRNSKYAQSDLGDVFKKILDLLEREKYLIFVGTPCQVAGLKAFLQKDYEKLITVDLVCRSIPSPTLWRRYLDWQEKRYKSKIKKVACRKKTYGYHSGALEIEFENGKRYAGSNRIDYYMKSFHSDICSRYSCYNCNFKTKHRCSDFTVFDCWEPQKVATAQLCDNDCGFSNVIVHTDKGKDMLYSIKDIFINEADAEMMFCFTGGMESKSIDKKGERETFYKDVDDFGFCNGVKKYVKVSTLDFVIESLKPVKYFLKKGHKR